jgi:hypothetical protein
MNCAAACQIPKFSVRLCSGTGVSVLSVISYKLLVTDLNAFCFTLGKNATETLKMLEVAFEG